MQERIKPSKLWMIAGAVIIFLMFNHWMSREISSPTPTQQMVNNGASEIPVQQKQTLIVPKLSDQEKTVAVPVDQIKKPKKADQSDLGPSEPIYEPPSNNVILVQ